MCTYGRVCSWQGLPAEEGTEGGEVLRGEEDPSPLNLGTTSGSLLPHWQALWNGRAQVGASCSAAYVSY